MEYSKIAFGIFCFGEDFYYKGTLDKIYKILNEGFHCYILTDNCEYFEKKYMSPFMHCISYERKIKSYYDKVLLVKNIFKEFDICILIDADCDIKNTDILRVLKKYKYKEGISYVNTLKNHICNKESVGEIVISSHDEWKYFYECAKNKYENFLDLPMIWEYFMVFNKLGFNENFFMHYETLQLSKEYSDLNLNKKVLGAGEGISIQISALLENIPIQLDDELSKIVTNTFLPISKHYISQSNPPSWMK